MNPQYAISVKTCDQEFPGTNGWERVQDPNSTVDGVITELAKESRLYLSRAGGNPTILTFERIPDEVTANPHVMESYQRGEIKKTYTHLKVESR